jgi:hypothetical protein
MRDFWHDSGYHLLTETAEGRLGVSDDFLRAYLMRPEIRPVEESCAAERALHESLMADPRRAVSEPEIAQLQDPDAQDNYRVVLGFRDYLLDAGDIEASYLGCFTGPAGAQVPPLFLDQMAHVILRHILDGTGDGLRARAAELLFREQRITIQDGNILSADAETVEMYAASGGFGALGQLISEAQTPLRSVELEVLDERNPDLYWGRDQAYDTVLNLSFAGGGLDALCRVLEAWVRHFLAIEVNIQPVQKIRDERWVWHVGLDAEGSALLNDLYTGEEVDEARMTRLLSLFRLEFSDSRVMRRSIAGRPVYLAMAMSEDSRLRLKPQNLLVSLPLAEPT